MRFDIAQILGMVLVVASAQGLIRQLIDHESTGLLGWLPVEFGGRVAVYAVVLVLGVLLTGWAHSRAKEAGRRG
ncbi:hypothetical protein EWH70_19245 [Amycolatopsis suaedae]|uniref:Uncharacterized protein n=2 Tax=Amycolatopsis suaedae TaxID=2510978 RepID=A0A4Q7J6R2_9PSEU|nr:hypothetical protein EWH70_19245 [Amycolatopsis suaedae]